MNRCGIQAWAFGQGMLGFQGLGERSRRLALLCEEFHGRTFSENRVKVELLNQTESRL